jgi:hypothetical protein
MRGFQLLVLVALLIGELHCARTAAPPADAPATSPQSPEPPPADQQAPPQAPGPSPPPPRRRGSPHRRPTAPPTQDPAPPKQEPPEPAPPRLVVPPEDSPAPTPPGMINHTTGCTTLLVLGDSTVDPGNNNHLPTTARANFLPYGLNFYGRRPTGRFTNGRLATDMLGNKTHLCICSCLRYYFFFDSQHGVDMHSGTTKSSTRSRHLSSESIYIFICSRETATTSRIKEAKL